MRQRLLLVFLWGSALWTCPVAMAQLQPEVESQTVFEIEDGGKPRRFDLAQDELAEKPSGGKERTARMATSAKDFGEMRKKAEALEAATGVKQDIVLYEKGKPRDESTRRVLTRKVLLKTDDRFDLNAAAVKIHAVATEKPRYAPGHVILTVKGPGDALAVLKVLRALPGVLSAEPMLARQQKRKLIPNDTLFSYNAANPGYQWHLRNTGQLPGTLGIDVNVTTVWDSYTGLGIRMGIVDDGLEVAHPDLSPNADTVNDHDWNDATPDDPTGNPSSDTHGTACAGVAGASGSNGLGVSGAAPNAMLVGLRLIAGSISDADEAEALSWKNNIIQLYSNSWGPSDDGSDLRDAGPLVKQALANGATTGRDGKGSIWLWAAGNGGDVQDNSNYDGYANSIYTIAVAAMNDTGGRSAYSEPGANVLICAPSNDITGSHRGITTTTTNAGYTYSFGGTSSATPLAAGVAALLLQSNPNLGWRDVKEILLRSATKVNAAHSDWINNGAGYHFNHEYGAGLINAQAAVTMASSWTNLGPQVTNQIAQTGLSVAIPDNNATGVTRTFTVPGTVAMRVEHATLHVAATHGRRGDLEITLTSPSGTASKLFVNHFGDSNLNLDWTFSSVRHWGEAASGNWTMKIADRAGGTAGTLTGATLTLYGANTAPPAGPPVISSPLAAGGNVDSLFNYQITATNNPQTFAATGLPPGLNLSASGLIQGTPEQEGVFNANLSATNALGTGNATLVLSVGPRIPTPPVITSLLSAAGVLNVPFQYQITATNAPLSFTASNLPAGITVNTTTGAISGIPTASGTFNVSITATNADGIDTKNLVLNISLTASALAQAVDAPQLIFTTGGNAPWVVPATSTHDGIDAAESGDIIDDQQSWMETTITGPAYINFWFRLSSESGYDFFRFSIDGKELWYSDGEHAWRQLGFFVPAGIHTVRWNYTKDNLFSSGFDRLWVDQVSVQGVQQLLGNVLDNPNLTWVMPSADSWVMQDRRTIDGSDALISPIYLDHGRSSSVEALVMGPGTISFWWTVSSELDYDFFRFEVDNTVQTEISGNNGGDNIPWTQQSFSIPAGLHTVRWRYIKDETAADGLDACWLDQITYTPNFASGPPYAQWLNGLFPSHQLGNGLITGPEVDGDGDGRINLHEYAFGGSPLIYDSATPVVTQTVGNEVFFEYSTDDAKTDLSIIPRLSNDLGSWTNATGEFVSQSGGQSHWRVRVPQSTGRKFFRLQANMLP